MVLTLLRWICAAPGTVVAVAFAFGFATEVSARLGALSEELLLELNAVQPPSLLLGFVHGVCVNRLVDTVIGG